MSTEYKLVEDTACASCETEHVPLAEFPWRQYRDDHHDKDQSTVLLCEVCSTSYISTVVTQYSDRYTTTDVSLARIIGAVTNMILTEVRSLKAEVAVLRAGVEGTDEDSSEPRPDYRTCVHCKQRIWTDGADWYGWADDDDTCEVNPEFGKHHEPEPNDKDDEA